MKESEIMERLGLEPWDQFATKQARYNLSDERVREIGSERAIKEAFRGTGRTTRHAVLALEALTECGTPVMCQEKTACGAEGICSFVGDMAVRLGIDAKTIESCIVVDPLGYDGGRSGVRYRGLTGYSGVYYFITPDESADA